MKVHKTIIALGASLALIGCAEVKKAPEPNMSHLIPVNTAMPPEMTMPSAPTSDVPHVEPGDAPVPHHRIRRRVVPLTVSPPPVAVVAPVAAPAAVAPAPVVPPSAPAPVVPPSAPTPAAAPSVQTDKP